MPPIRSVENMSLGLTELLADWSTVFTVSIGCVAATDTPDATAPATKCSHRFRPSERGRVIAPRTMRRGDEGRRDVEGAWGDGDVAGR